MTINPFHAASDPRWWSSSAVVDGRFVVKFAWSQTRATLLWREGVVMERLATSEPALPIPEVVGLSRAPALVITRLVAGAPLAWDWGRSLNDAETKAVADQLAQFLVRLHHVEPAHVIRDLPVVVPTPQADTQGLRDRFPRLVDARRAASVLRWCEWVDAVLGEGRSTEPGVVVHGDLHGHNQVWDRESSRLLVVVDFEESGLGDPHYDLRYLPTNAHNLELTLAVMRAYERGCGRRLTVERVMAWHVLTTLGDALWRTEARVALPGGGTPATYVDDLFNRLESLELV